LSRNKQKVKLSREEKIPPDYSGEIIYKLQKFNKPEIQRFEISAFSLQLSDSIVPGESRCFYNRIPCSLAILSSRGGCVDQRDILLFELILAIAKESF
jgi:hypothetical protein